MIQLYLGINEYSGELKHFHFAEGHDTVPNVGILSRTSQFRVRCSTTRPRGYKTFFKLSSAEHEISTADKCLNGKKLWNIQVQN